MKNWIPSTGILAAAVVVSTSHAQSYEQIATLPELLGPGNSGFLDTVATDGTDYYAFGRSFGSVAGSGDSLTAFTGGGSSVLINDTQWASASSGTLGGFYGARVVGDDIVFANFFDNSVYSVDKTTGVVTTIASPANANFTSASAVASDGTTYAFDGTSDSILKIETNGTVSTAVSQATLSSAFGGGTITSVNGGLEVVGDSLYVGRDAANDMVAFSLTDSTFTSVFSSAAVVDTAVGDSDGDIDFEDIYLGGDGLVYFFEDDTDSIVSFDPSNPDGTVTQVLSSADLLAGPGTNNVDQFGWYNGQLAWTDQDDFNDDGGFFAIPEPTTAALLGLAGMAMLRRRNA